MKPLKHHIERIQNSDEATKHFWLYVFSSISMLFVLVLWTGYMNLAIPNVPGPKKDQNSKIVETQANKQISENSKSIFAASLETIINGAGTRLSRGIATIKKTILPSNKTINVDRTKPQFIMENLETLPEGILPN